MVAVGTRQRPGGQGTRGFAAPLEGNNSIKHIYIYIYYNREDQKRFQKAKRVGGLTFLAFLILLHAPERVGDASELPARHDVSNSRSVPLN